MSILRLQLPTDPRWVDLAGKSLEFILTDHAYCEQKAASTCISLIQLYPDKTELVEQLAPIVTEEWGHFRMVLAQMKKRNISLGRQRKDEYVRELRKFLTVGNSKHNRLLDMLLMAGLIEARSCERFKLLWKNIGDEELSQFYYKLMVSEAGHYTLFLGLARTYFSEEQVKTRWAEWLEYEKKVMDGLAVRGDRIH
ncbi:MAG: tRNA-(ms[2]io[6]A)-hydroxylase [Chitinophagales bacterium]